MATVENVLDVLLIFESAAGAHIMMREFSGNPLTLMEEAELFEAPEGFNDSETERLIKSLTPTQFTALVDKLKLINEEEVMAVPGPGKYDVLPFNI